MKKIINNGILLLLSLFLWSCYVAEQTPEDQSKILNDQQIQQYIRENNLNAQGTGSGLFYVKLVNNPAGQQPQTGDSVKIHFVARLLSGKIVDSTSTYFNRPDGLILGTNTVIAGLEEGIRLMRVGEKMRLIIPSYLAYNNRATTYIPPFSVLIYEVSLESVKTEEQQIAEFITRKGLTITTLTDSKLRYIKVSAGAAGAKVYDGNNIIVNYKGTLLNDFVFDSRADSSFSFPLGLGTVIKGWDEGIKLTEEGEKAYFIIPSSLGYGASGSGSRIPPYAPLFFEITHVKSDRRRIIEYIASQNWNDTTRTSSGLYTRTLQTNPVGVQPNANSTVSYNYAVILLDGTNTVVKSGINVSGVLNANNENLTTGMREGMRLMRQGERWMFLMPANLAYGSAGSGAVPKRTPVRVDIDLISVQ
jgi:FKBP-type peptidyl-prolyl cis-trans isomerase